MNPNLWNIKEILSIPPGNSGIKNTSRHVTSGHSSSSDPQFVPGSQFWPENSQGLSQEMGFSSRNSQHSSQEGSDPKISSNYSTKPFLFGGDWKDKANPLKAICILDKFEEDKKTAQERNERDVLSKECLHYRETLTNMRLSISGTEKNTAECKAILERLDNFASTLMQNFSSIQKENLQNFELLSNEGDLQKLMLTEMMKKVEKTGVATTELGLCVHNIQKNLEALRQELGREQNTLEEALKLLNTLVSSQLIKPRPERVTDCSIQTSPELLQSASTARKHCKSKGKQLTCSQLDDSQLKAPFRKSLSSSTRRRRRATVRGHRNSRRPLLLSESNKDTIWDKNSKLLAVQVKQEVVSPPHKVLCESNRIGSVQPADYLIQQDWETGHSKHREGFISPVSFWSQNSNSSVVTTGAEPCSEKSPPELKTKIPNRATSLWHLFDINYDSDSFPLEEW